MQKGGYPPLPVGSVGGNGFDGEAGFGALSEGGGQPFQAALPFGLEGVRGVGEDQAGRAQALFTGDVQGHEREFPDRGRLEFGFEAVELSAVLDGKPQNENAKRPFAVGGDEASGKRFEFFGRFERRIDQDKAALFLRRDQGWQHAVTVAGDDAGILVGADGLAQECCFLRVQFAEHDFVDGPCEVRQQRGRTGIEFDRWARVGPADEVEIGCERRGHVAAIDEAQDAVLGLAGLLSFASGQVVKTGAGMGVDQAERCFLLLQVAHNPAEQRVL